MDYSRLVWAVSTKAASLRDAAHLDTDAGAEIVVACLGAMRRLAEAHGARVHIVAHRLLHQRSTVSAPVWRDFLARSGATDMTDAILSGKGPDPVGYDGAHWSREGNRRVAQLILGAL